MSTSDNKKVVEDVLKLTGDDPFGAIADDVRWTVIGDRFSGTFNGKQGSSKAVRPADGPVAEAREHRRQEHQRRGGVRRRTRSSD
jgi:hypothetical protein